MDKDDTIYFQSLVILLFCVLVMGWVLCNCYKYMRTPTSCKEGNTQLQETPKQEVYQQFKKQAENLKTLQKELSQYRSEVATLRERLSMETNEKDDALKRLSALMSSRLRDGNPNVVDLSDQNRPVKVGEQFSELYDNQWTDSYTAIDTYFGHSKQEPEIISILFDILQKCFMVCKDKSNSQLVYMYESLTNIDAVITKKNSKLSSDLMQRVKEERKMFAYDELPEFDEVLSTLKKDFSTNILDIGFLEESFLKAFIQECLKLSWLMVIQDPPMTMLLKPEANVNDKFKPYKHRGKHVAFVVWPALLLEEGGALISKGIAEFRDEFASSEKLFDP